MTNPRETSVMMPVEPSEAVIKAIIAKAAYQFDYAFTDEVDAREIYRAIIAAHMQEMDE